MKELYKKALDTLDRFTLFEKGWDGYDAAPFSTKTIEITREIILEIERAFEILIDNPSDINLVPISDGIIYIYISYKDVKYKLIFTIDADKDILEIYNDKINKKFKYNINLISYFVYKLTDDYIGKIREILWDIQTDPDEINHLLECHTEDLPEWIKLIATKIEKIKEILHNQFENDDYYEN